MARELNKLDAATVRAKKEPGRYSDGGGLYLVVKDSGAKSWAFLFRWDGKLKEMGLGGLKGSGSLRGVSLAQARERAGECRDQLSEGLNPIEARKAARAVPTFGQMADSTVKALKKGWRNEKHITAWEMTLTTHAAPIRGKAVDKITTADVLDVLEPLADRPETASRLRGRIERVLNAAKAKGYIQGPWQNPAAWRGHLSELMGKRQKLSRGHHAAKPFVDMPAFMVALRSREATAALALEFLILTATRTSEVLLAEWDEIDLQAKVWTIPAKRTKAAREHRVPLSAPCVKILEKMSEAKRCSYIFPGPDNKRPLSTNALRALLQRMGETVTAHGFRSSFRDWCGEVSNFPRELAEQALAHRAGDATELAYRRGDAVEKRRRLMDSWANYCGRQPGSGNVHDIRRRA